MKRIFIALSWLLTQFVYAQHSYIAPARTLADGGKEYQFQLDYFQTTGIVDRTGEGFNLSNGSSYQLADFIANYKFAPTTGLEGLVGLRGRYISATQTLTINSETKDYDFQRSGLESALLGFKYSFKESEGWQFAFEGWYRYMLHTNSEYTGGVPAEISLGDDTREIAAGINLTKRSSSNNYLSVRSFYRTPSSNLSSEILTQAEGALVWDYISFALGIEYNSSLETDTYSSNPNDKPVYFNGPSFKFNSVNRSWTAPYAQMGLALGETWRVEARYAQIMTGQSTDLGPTISFALVKRVEESKEFAQINSKFKRYAIEGTVTKISDSRSACVIDRGLVQGLKAGMPVDFYYFDYVDGNELIAKGVVVKVGASKSLVRIKRRFSKRRVDVGTIARADRILE